jgi:transposase-like protein
MQTNNIKQKKMFSIVKQYNKGKLTTQQIFQQYSITKNSLKYWRNKYAAQQAGTHENTNVFLPITLEPEPQEQIATQLKITYPNGVVINIPNQNDLKLIQQLIHMA